MELELIENERIMKWLEIKDQESKIIEYQNKLQEK